MKCINLERKEWSIGVGKHLGKTKCCDRYSGFISLLSWERLPSRGSPTPKLTTVQSNNNIVRSEVKQALTLISASILFDFKLNVYVSGIKKTGNVWLGPTGSIRLPGRSLSLYSTSHRSSRVPTPVNIFLLEAGVQFSPLHSTFTTPVIFYQYRVTLHKDLCVVFTVITNCIPINIVCDLW